MGTWSLLSMGLPSTLRTTLGSKFKKAKYQFKDCLWGIFRPYVCIILLKKTWGRSQSWSNTTFRFLSVGDTWVPFTDTLFEKRNYGLEVYPLPPPFATRHGNCRNLHDWRCQIVSCCRNVFRKQCKNLCTSWVFYALST